MAKPWSEIKRTRKLRKAAAVNQWDAFTTHEGVPPRREPFDCGHARPRGVPLVGPYHVCPGCENQDRRNRRHWFLLAVAVALSLAVTCSARAAECAPYSPVDGRTCAPPARLGYMGTAPVCYCPGPKVAGR